MPRNQPPFFKVRCSIRNHEKMREVYSDNRLLAGWVRLGIYAIEVYADRTEDVFDVPDRRLMEIFGVGRPEVARSTLRQLANKSPITCEQVGAVWRITWPNLSKKQFPFRKDRSVSLASASASTSTPKKKTSSAERRAAPRSTPSPEADDFARKFRASLKAKTPDAKLPSDAGFARWVAEADRMFRIDERKPDEAGELAAWLFNDPGDDAAFWRANVRAVPKFRTRFEELRENRARGSRKKEKTDGGRDDALAAGQRYAERHGLGGLARK